LFPKAWLAGSFGEQDEQSETAQKSSTNLENTPTVKEIERASGRTRT